MFTELASLTKEIKTIRKHVMSIDTKLDTAVATLARVETLAKQRVEELIEKQYSEI